MKLWLWRTNLFAKWSATAPVERGGYWWAEDEEWFGPKYQRKVERILGVRWPRAGADPVCYELERPAKLKKAIRARRNR